jgi:chromosome segregation ATPase
VTPRKKGRSTSYTAEQLEEAVQRAEDRDGEASVGTVAQHLVAITGREPNRPILERNLDEVLAERQRKQEDALIAALPDTVTDPAERDIKEFRRAFFLALGRAHSQIDAAAEARDEERETVKRSLVLQISALEAECAELKTGIAELEKERDAATKRIAELERELVAARADARARAEIDPVLGQLQEVLRHLDTADGAGS